ncbi:FHA domain-containing protein [Lignipirellula cremea]|uniref:FHA domain protein n=1 Tax=Lignipirellula cremea TaxID=2528010 RepID=A0A518DZN5_9BACT|nr:FHA domain-containing protein [Lignipirellula cremea]QDU97293.1 FHA domain protein [Lignipirellula cremea]
MQVKLIVKGGKNEGREVPVKGPQFIIGRADGCHLRPRTDTVSRKHCVITIDDRGVTIRDLKSRNGVIINDRKIEERTALKPGDVLRIGSLTFEVMIDHSLGGSKRPKVQDVKEAAVRSAGGHQRLEEDDVASWLEDPSEMDRTRQLADPETRQFTLDETEQIILKRSDEVEETAVPAAEKDTIAEAEKTKEAKKLPQLNKPQAKDSVDAATDMLKKFFNRR